MSLLQQAEVLLGQVLADDFRAGLSQKFIEARPEFLYQKSCCGWRQGKLTYRRILSFSTLNFKSQDHFVLTVSTLDTQGCHHSYGLVPVLTIGRSNFV